MLSRWIIAIGTTSIGVLLGVIMASALVPIEPPHPGFHKGWPQPFELSAADHRPTRPLHAERSKVEALWEHIPENVLVYNGAVPVWEGPIPQLSELPGRIEVE